MPNYNVKNKKTGKIKQITMSISEMEAYLKKFPGMDIIPGAPLIGYHGVMGLTNLTPDTDFKSRLKEISKRSPGNHMNKVTKI